MSAGGGQWFEDVLYFTPQLGRAGDPAQEDGGLRKGGSAAGLRSSGHQLHVNEWTRNLALHRAPRRVHAPNTRSFLAVPVVRLVHTLF